MSSKQLKNNLKKAGAPCERTFFVSIVFKKSKKYGKTIVTENQVKIKGLPFSKTTSKNFLKARHVVCSYS